MFFYASKLISVLIWPSNIIGMLLVGGVALLVLGKAAVLARRMLAAAAIGFVACGYSPLGLGMLLPLENRFVRPPLPQSLTGIIMLGGFESASLGRVRGELNLSDAAERLTEALRVAHLRPQARVAFAGGDGSLSGATGSASSEIARFLIEVGVAEQRIVLESESRTTYENAANLRRIVNPRPGENWLLVTSAFHMPRAMGTFRKAGFDVLPWPSDYRTRGTQDLAEVADIPTGGMMRVDMAFKEWVGLLAYRLSGRTDALWPGPDTPVGPAISAPVPPTPASPTGGALARPAPQ